MMESPTPRRGRKRTRESLGSVRALDRGLAVLEALAEGRELPLSEIARRVELPFSTTHRLLETLVRRAFVVQSRESGLYRIGVRAFEVGSGLMQDRLYEVAHPQMKALMEEFNETVNLAVLDGKEAVFVRQVEGRHLVRMLAKPGARAALHCTAAGKALLSGLTDDEVVALLGHETLHAYTKNTRTRLPEILEEVRRVRARGFALDQEEREAGVRCAAAPVRVNGEVVAAVAIAAPGSRVPKARQLQIGRRLAEAAEAISAQLGRHT